MILLLKFHKNLHDLFYNFLVRNLTLLFVILYQTKKYIMKKKSITNLKLTKKTVSKINELNQTIVGGEDSFGPERCMEDFTLGCSPTFQTQCPVPPTTLITDAENCTSPQYCW